MSGRPDVAPRLEDANDAARVESRVRVLVVAPSLDLVGGQSVQASRLVKRLADDAGLDVRFVAVNPRLPGVLRHLQSIKYVRTVVTTVAYLVALVRAARDADVVHAFSASYASYLLAPLPALVVARLFRRAAVLNYHSGEAEDHLARWPRSRRTMRLATAIVVPTRYLVEIFAAVGLRASAIPNALDADAIPYRRRTGLRPRVLANRNLEPLYNVPCVLRAFARIQAVHPDATLVVAGEGSQRAALEQLVQSLALRNVTFAGRVAPSAMGRLYDEADLYLNASNIDNMPLSILEAQAAGMPVVSTDAGGIPHLVTHGATGMLAPRDDDAALAAGALALLADSQLATGVADRARMAFTQRYVWDAVRADWGQLYRRLAPPRRASRASAALATTLEPERR